MGEQNAGALDVAWTVRRAAEGDHQAWERLVEQYARLVWAMTRDFRLVESDAADVAQMTWLRLLENIDRLESPDRVGSWLATTARRECLRSVAARKKVVLVGDDAALSDAAEDAPEVDERLLAEERSRDVREALSSLPVRWQRLLELLMSDPPVSYAEISDELGLPIGSIGPTRARCLAKLRAVLQSSQPSRQAADGSYDRPAWAPKFKEGARSSRVATVGHLQSAALWLYGETSGSQPRSLHRRQYFRLASIHRPNSGDRSRMSAPDKRDLVVPVGMLALLGLRIVLNVVHDIWQ